jgi:hypothetical protein
LRLEIAHPESLQFMLWDSDYFSGLALRDACGIDKFFDSDNQMAFTNDLFRLFDPQVFADVAAALLFRICLAWASAPLRRIETADVSGSQGFSLLYNTIPPQPYGGQRSWLAGS